MVLFNVHFMHTALRTVKKIDENLVFKKYFTQFILHSCILYRGFLNTVYSMIYPF
jgi:hypothetical protein